MSPPRHIRIPDSLGRTRTLADGPEAFVSLSVAERIAPNAPLLLLGLGPRPDAAPATSPSRETWWLECPEFTRRLAEATGGPVPPPPSRWRRLAPRDAPRFVGERQPEILLYRQNEVLFPDFWGPLLARLRLAGRAPAENGPARDIPRPSALLPGTSRDLLHLELWDALSAEGLDPLPLPPARGNSPAAEEEFLSALLRLTDRQRPAFCLSVNLRGLDPAGRVFHLLRAMGVPVAIWFVDNPWHILSSLRLPWWREAALFVTDAAFVPDLRRHGAGLVRHLPLASSPLFFARPAPPPASKTPEGRLLFVGRSAFPRHDAFFAAAAPPAALLQQAEDLLAGEASPVLPHFHWWAARMGIDALWPGQNARLIGAGAEACSRKNRTLWLERAAATGLTVAGDDGWRALLAKADPAPRLLPPVDYYTELADLYRRFPYTLNITSLLLPDGLTQRHFDVWAAGGFLLNADGRGMDIFPSDLADIISCGPDRPLPDLVAFFDSRPALRREVGNEWRKLIGESHTYRHRIRFVADILSRTLDDTIQEL